jgi:hypothetical protein
MFSYYNLVVSNAQADRSEQAGYRVASGAKAEISTDAIRRDLSEGRTARRAGFVPRLALMLAASAALIFAGIQGASAQGQSGMFADADGMEPPDMGIAYTLPTRSSVAVTDTATGGEDATLTADVDGIEPPDIGVAYELPVNAVVATKRSVLWPELTALLADADGIEPPNSGFAYVLPVQTSIVSADRVPAEEHAGLVYDADGIEPPDIGVAYDIDPAVEAYVERRQRAKRVAARPGEDK